MAEILPSPQLMEKKALNFFVKNKNTPGPKNEKREKEEEHHEATP